MAEIAEGSTTYERIRRWGNSLVIPITPQDQEYLSVGEESELVKKYDKGKHGRFIGIGKKKA